LEARLEAAEKHMKKAVNSGSFTYSARFLEDEFIAFLTNKTE